MSRSFKRSILDAWNHESGRVGIIRKHPDHEVCHSKDCYMCGNGKKPSRILHIKPRRAREKRELQAIIREELLA